MPKSFSVPTFAADEVRRYAIACCFPFLAISLRPQRVWHYQDKHTVTREQGAIWRKLQRLRRIARRSPFDDGEIRHALSPSREHAGAWALEASSSQSRHFV